MKMDGKKVKTKKKRDLIYVFASKDESLVGGKCQELLEQLLEPEQRSTGLLSVEANEVAAADVFDELRTLPFLTDKRVVVVKKADDFVSANRELLEKYFDDPCPTGILVLTVSTWPAQTRLARKLAGVGRLIKVTQPKPWQLPYRLIEYAHDVHDKKLAKDAAELLVELTGDDLARLYSEIDKLALFVDDAKAITAEHIESLIGHNRIFGAFAVIDTIIAGDTAGAIERLRNMFSEDRTAEYSVVGAFAFHMRRMFQAKALLERGISPAEIMKKLRVWSNKEGFFAQLKAMSLEQIGSNLSRLAEIDYAIKTGRARAPAAVEQFVLGLAGGTRPVSTLRTA
jgi:DNA polymerase-3 subunit delta